MAKLWLTRPAGMAEKTAAALRDMGHGVICEPLLRYNSLPSEAVDLQNGVLVFTSAFAVRAFCGAYGERDNTAFCVGDSTAAAARSFGFSQVHSADGDVTALQELLKKRVGKERKIWHFAAAETAGDLQGAMAEQGFVVERRALYETVPTDILSDSLCDMVKGGEVTGVLLYSPKTARVFCGLQGRYQLPLERVTAFCLSGNVAREISDLEWREIVIAKTPKEADLLAVIGQFAN